MIVYIVIDESTDVLKRYDEKYKIFREFSNARAHAKRIGFQEGFMALSETNGGIRQNFQCGEKDISLITLEVEE